MNYTYDPYFSDFFDITYLTQTTCTNQLYLDPFYDSDADPNYPDTTGNPYFDGCVFYNYTWDPYYLWYYGMSYTYSFGRGGLVPSSARVTSGYSYSYTNSGSFSGFGGGSSSGSVGGSTSVTTTTTTTTPVSGGG